MERGDDPYKILEVSKSASPDEIKKSYRKLALKFHPDRQTDDKQRKQSEGKFAQIAAAYELLSDEEARKLYDSFQDVDKPKGFDNRKVDFSFNSPYEVWKRDFEKQFGFAYPGSKWDFSNNVKKLKDDESKKKNPKLITDGSNRRANTSNTSKTNKSPKTARRKSVPVYTSSDNSSISDSSDSDSDTKSRRSFFKPFWKSSSNETSIVPHKSNNWFQKDTSKALVNKHGSKDNQLARSRGCTENQLVKSYGIDGDNRPISMLTTQKEVKHKDGTVETIVETKMTRPDGSVETVRMTDKAEKHSDWRTPEKKKLLQLTNGEKRKELTNGKKHKELTNGPKSSNNNKKPLAITNGEKTRSPSSKKSNKKSVDTSYSFKPDSASNRMSLR